MESYVTKEEMYFKYLPNLKIMAMRFKEDAEDLLSEFYIKLTTSKINSEDILTPENYITRSFRNYSYNFYARRESFVYPSDLKDQFGNYQLNDTTNFFAKLANEEEVPCNETVYSNVEVIQVFKDLAKGILHPRQYVVFSAVIDAALEDHGESRSVAAHRLGVSRNLVKVTMFECMKLLNKHNYRNKLKELGYAIN